MSTTKAEKSFTFREGGKVKLYNKGDVLTAAALAHAQANGFVPAPEKAEPDAAPAPKEAKPKGAPAVVAEPK